MVTQTLLKIATTKPREIVEITEEVRAVVRDSGVTTGICQIFVAGATGGIVVNEGDDPAICDDLLDLLDRLIPQSVWRHDRIDNNGAAHLKSSWVGPSETVPIREGNLLLGTWQNLFLCDFDGPRAGRPVWVTVYGE